MSTGTRRRFRFLTVLACAGGLLALSGCVTAPIWPGWQTFSAEEVDSWGDDPAGFAVVGECPWSLTSTSAPTSPAPEATTVTEPRAEAEAIALAEDLFWPFVEGLPDNPSDDDFGAAAGALAGCGMDAVWAFEARLTLTLYDLDGPENFAWFEENDPDHLGFVSSDTFLYARCATVLAGRDVWERAVADGTLEWADDSLHETGMSELLLYVSWDAAGALGYTVDQYLGGSPTTLSYETGSNLERWEGGE